MYGFKFLYKDSANGCYERLLTDYRMQSIKHKGNKKSRDPNKSLCFLYSFILYLRMCNASQADHANGYSNRYSYVLHNHQ